MKKRVVSVPLRVLMQRQKWRSRRSKAELLVFGAVTRAFWTAMASGAVGKAASATGGSIFSTWRASYAEATLTVGTMVEPGLRVCVRPSHLGEISSGPGGSPTSRRVAGR